MLPPKCFLLSTLIYKKAACLRDTYLSVCLISSLNPKFCRKGWGGGGCFKTLNMLNFAVLSMDHALEACFWADFKAKMAKIWMIWKSCQICVGCGFFKSWYLEEIMVKIWCFLHQMRFWNEICFLHTPLIDIVVHTMDFILKYLDWKIKNSQMNESILKNWTIIVQHPVIYILWITDIQKL